MPTKKKSSKKFNISGVKNWVILGAAGFGGYYLYTKVIAPELKDISADLKDAGKKKPGAGGPQPDLNGPAVTRFEVASTRSKLCIGEADKRFVYAPITSTNSAGYQTFNAPVAGNFTRRLLCKGGKKWAELKPA